MGIKGRVGARGFTLEHGYQAAKEAGLVMLATLKNDLGSLRRVKRLVKHTGYVNIDPRFKGPETAKVVSGFSDLMIQVFGQEMGKGARTSIGAAPPGNFPVEVDAIF